MSRRTALLDVALPGAGLLLADHPLGAIVCLLTALTSAAALVLGALVATPAAWDRLWPVAGGAYLLLGLGSAILHLVWERDLPTSHPAVAAGHRLLVRAWCAGDARAALDHARTLVRLAPGHPGAWDLLGRIAAAAGQPGRARHARHRCGHLRAR
jgi:hypothetical protein